MAAVNASVVLFGGSDRDLARRQHTPHNWCVELVFVIQHVSSVVMGSEDENRESSFLIEVLLSDGHRKDAVESMLAISSLVAMLPQVPGEDPDLIVVIRRTVVRLGEEA